MTTSATPSMTDFDYDYDLVIIGSGPSGRTAAIQAGKLKRRVLVIDRADRLGGVSVHTGTVPSKTLRETVLNLSGWRERSFYGRSYRVKDQIAAEDLKARLHMTLDHEVDVLEHQFNRNHVEWLAGLAKFTGPNEVEVATEAGDTTRITSEKFLIATGTRTYRPDDVPFNGKTVVDGDEFLEMSSIPRSLIVVGAGVIGVEYATMFSTLDVRVTLIEPRDTFLDFIDSTLIQDFTHQIRENGVDLRLGSAIDKIEDAGNHIEVSLNNGRHVRGEMLLFAAGRMGNTDGLNLAAVGLETDHRGRLSVERKTYQTAVPHIYATGDVIGHPSLASTSLQQGRVAACHALETPTLPESPLVSLWHLLGARDVHLRHVGGRATGTWYPLRDRCRPLPRDLARAYHGAGTWYAEDAHQPQNPPGSGGSDRGRRRHRADSHRPGGDESAGYGGLFCPEYLQLSDSGRSLQNRRARRLQPHANPRRVQGEKTHKTGGKGQVTTCQKYR